MLYKNIIRNAYQRLTSSRFKVDPRQHALARDGIDIKLSPYLPKQGFFIEAGGYDGTTASNTYYLEQVQGWRGILIEPDPEMYAKCSTARPLAHVVNSALIPFSYRESEIELTVIGNDRSMSLVEGATKCPKAQEFISKGEARQVKVPAVSLSQLIESLDLQHIDFLSLDVEGYELQVLKGVDFEQHKITAILVESLSEDERNKVEELLTDNYDRVAQLSERDTLYIRKELKS